MSFYMETGGDAVFLLGGDPPGGDFGKRLFAWSFLT